MLASHFVGLEVILEFVECYSCDYGKPQTITYCYSNLDSEDASIIGKDR